MKTKVIRAETSPLKVISFLPHHFMCTLGFVGNGYHDNFINNMEKIVNQLKHNKQIILQVVQENDNICSACSHAQGNICYQKQQIQPIDDGYQSLLKLNIGEFITWENAQKRIAHTVTLNDFHKICASCKWKSQGHCETALKNLLTLWSS